VLGRVGLPAWAPRGVKVGTLSIVAASLVLAVMIVSWPHLFSSGSRSPRPAPGQIGEAEGWVKSAAPSTNTIRVSSGFLGLSSVGCQSTSFEFDPTLFHWFESHTAPVAPDVLAAGSGLAPA